MAVVERQRTHARSLIVVLLAFVVTTAGQLFPSAPATAAGPSASAKSGVMASTAAAAPTTEAFVPIDPVRMLETRTGAMPRAATVTTVAIGGRFGVPSGARAVALNVTAVSPTSAGYLTVFPAGRARPTASNLNFVAQQTIANQVIVDLGSASSISIYTSSAAHILVDVTGYFPTGKSFTGIVPTRIRDTRSEQIGPHPASTTSVQVAGLAGVPTSGVKAAVLNVTAVAPTSSGYLTVFAGDTRPTVSNVNYQAQENIAGLVVTELTRDGKVDIYTSAGTQLIVDVLGWIPVGSSYMPVRPGRLLDTRTASAPTGGSVVKVPIAGRLNVPTSGVLVAEVTVTAVTPQKAGYLTVFPGAAVPTASNLNFRAGRTIANSVTAKVGPDGSISVRVSDQTHVLVDLVGFGIAGTTGSWDAPTTVISANRDFVGIDCENEQFCVAVSGNGTIARWNGAGWMSPLVDRLTSWTAVSCSAVDHCVATGMRGVDLSAQTSPVYSVWNGTDWSSPASLPGTAPVAALSCPSATFCLAVGTQVNGNGAVVRSYDGATWTTRPGPSVAGLTAVACVTATFCIAGTSTGGATRWSGVGTAWFYAPEFLDHEVTSVSCAHERLCIMTGRGYGVVTYDGTFTAQYGAPAIWSPMASCSPTRCVVVGDHGVHLVYRPGSGFSRFYSSTNEDGFSAISCPTDAFCARTTMGGTASTMTDDQGWRGQTALAAGQGSLVAVDCPTVDTCVMADYAGRRFTVTGQTVGPVFNGTEGPRAISCSDASNCATAGQSSGYLRSTVLIDGVWTELQTRGESRDVSCVTPAFCLKVGTLFSERWTGTAWTSVRDGNEAQDRVECPETNWCVAIKNDSGVARARTWNGTRMDFGITDIKQGLNILDISCAARESCVAVTRDDRTYRLSGTSWVDVTAAPAGAFLISCPATTWCMAIDRNRTSHVFDGVSWKLVDVLPGASPLALSCPQVGRCTAVDSAGSVRHYLA